MTSAASGYSGTALAAKLGFVDVKVAAKNEIRSGLKLVIRKDLR